MDGPHTGIVLVPVWTERTVLNLEIRLQILLGTLVYQKWTDQLAAFKMDKTVQRLYNPNE